MCGIAGSINYPIDYDIIRSTMLHRGPDAQSGYKIDNIDFFHLRLSIVDILGGFQPMHLNERYTIIFNGEIYNHLEIRKKFSLIGKTTSDTETLLLLYEKLGIDFLHELDGMFAFALYDQQNKKLVLARDRAGKKPIYYYQDKDSFVFTSELNCLKSLVKGLQINEAAFYNYFRLGVFYKEMTPYENVFELEAGSYMEINCTTYTKEIFKWWDIKNYYAQSQKEDFDSCLAKVDSYLNTAIQRRIESSDLEVGCFLSGGIDSGLVTAIASKLKPSLKTFTVKFEGTYDESALAQLVANQYHTKHEEIEISFNHLNDDIEKIISNYGEPFFDSSAIPSYYVSKEAKKHVTVILNGDGADELFGGYRRYVPFAKFDFFNQNQFIKSASKGLNKVLPFPKDKKSKYNYFHRLIALAAKDHLGIYLSASVDIFEGYEQYILPGNSSEMLRQMELDYEIIASTNLSGLQKIMQLDFQTNLQCDLLVKMDIATMANSLEGRSPFLCKELLEYVPSIMDEYKINGVSTKYLLRQLAKKYLPHEIINQPKRGFEIPLVNWVNQDLRNIIFDYVGSSNAYAKNFINNNFINALLANTINIPAEKRAKILWMLFCMEIWYKKIYLNA
jgi:asparagine synthase (glutamine-hydrolysing)